MATAPEVKTMMIKVLQTLGSTEDNVEKYFIAGMSIIIIVKPNHRQSVIVIDIFKEYFPKVVDEPQEKAASKEKRPL